MRVLSQSTAPTIEPLSLAEVLDHLKISAGTEDQYVTALITAARQWTEHYLRRQLLTATWLLELDKWPTAEEWPGAWIRLDWPPVASVTHVKYYDTNGALQTLASSNYQVDVATLGGRIVLASGASLPTLQSTKIKAIQITFTAGYGAAASAVPMPIRQAMLLLIGDMYENREAQIVGTIVAENRTAMMLLGPYRYLNFEGNS